MVKEPVDSWSILFDEDYKGEILMIDNPRDAMGVALQYLGYSINTTDREELQAAYDLLRSQKPILQAYVKMCIRDSCWDGPKRSAPHCWQTPTGGSVSAG